MNQEDFQKQVLAQLGEIAGWFRFQRKLMKWVWCIAAIPLLMAFGLPLWIKSTTKRLSNDVGKTSFSWYDAENDYRAGRVEDGLRKVNELLKEVPGYPRGYQTQGSFYLLKNDLVNAEKSFAKAAELWPSKEHKENLEAIRERIAKTTQPKER
jgi:hypothetical protein